MEDKLGEVLKKYVNIFITEYTSYLSNDQLEILRNIDYKHIISFGDISIPFGNISLGQIVLSKSNEELIKSMSNMKEYNHYRYQLNNKNLSSYLKYMCDNGYSLLEYMSDILMYFVFFMVIKNHSPLIYGIIDQEMRFLSIKYSFKCAFLFAKEDFIVSKMTPIIKMDMLRKVLFMDKVSSFKYLSENRGFRYANLLEKINDLLSMEYPNFNEKNYSGFDGFLNYTEDYDQILYTDAYDYLLEFKARNDINY